MSKKMIFSNKSDKPENIMLKEFNLNENIKKIENQFPDFFYDFFLYLKNSVSNSTRLAYLEDIKFFLNYLISETSIVSSDNIKDISVDEFRTITARDINRFIGYHCSSYAKETEKNIQIIENGNKSLSRKKSSLSVLFKYLYREEVLKKNITDGFNPIKMPRPQPDAIKRLEIYEINELINLLNTGELLTEKEKDYWKKTRYRDKAIILLFITYGLRISELQQLNISSFNFKRGEFKIYRKRGKEVLMPINNTCKKVLDDYFNFERDSIKNKIDENHIDALFLSLQYKRLTVKAIRNLVKKYTSIVLNTSKNKGYSPHKLRATAATSLIEKGFSIYDVQNLLDHENITTTQLYAAHRKNAKKEVISNFELIDE